MSNLKMVSKETFTKVWEGFKNHWGQCRSLSLVRVAMSLSTGQKAWRGGAVTRTWKRKQEINISLLFLSLPWISWWCCPSTKSNRKPEGREAHWDSLYKPPFTGRENRKKVKSGFRGQMEDIQERCTHRLRGSGCVSTENSNNLYYWVLNFKTIYF